MNKLAVQRQSRPLLPELSELFTAFRRSPASALAGLRPFFDNNLLRLEDETHDGLYQVRAELPGRRPDRRHRGHRARRPADDQGRAHPDRASPTGTRSSRTDRSPGPFRCPRAPTRTTSTPPTTGASSLFRCRCPTTEPTEKHVEVFEIILVDENDDEDMTKTCTRTTTTTIRTISARRPTSRRRRSAPLRRLNLIAYPRRGGST